MKSDALKDTFSEEIALIDIDIDRVKSEINDTSIGLSMLGIFFIALIPLFYSIIGIYRFTFRDIQLPLVLSVAIVFLATILAVLHWENKKKTLNKLFDVKKELIIKRHHAHQSTKN